MQVLQAGSPASHVLQHITNRRAAKVCRKTVTGSLRAARFYHQHTANSPGVQEAPAAGSFLVSEAQTQTHSGTAGPTDWKFRLQLKNSSLYFPNSRNSPYINTPFSNQSIGEIDDAIFCRS